MRRIALLLLALAAGPALGQSQDALRQDMVMLDKVYIAALALTSQGKAAESRKALAQLTQSWQQFRQRYRDASPRDAQWQADFDAVSRMIGEADAILASERKPTDAHEALEEVRIVMMKLRARNGIEYFVDRLTAFHEPMEAIVLAAKDKAPASLSDGDIARIRSHLAETEDLWRVVMAAPFDAATYRLDPPQFEQARNRMQLEQQALAELGAALDSGEKARIIKAAVGIKPHFAALFMIFGDFRPYRG